MGVDSVFGVVTELEATEDAFDISVSGSVSDSVSVITSDSASVRISECVSVVTSFSISA